MEHEYRKATVIMLLSRRLVALMSYHMAPTHCDAVSWAQTYASFGRHTGTHVIPLRRSLMTVANVSRDQVPQSEA